MSSSLRSTARLALSGILYGSGILPYVRRRRTDQVCIFCLHRVLTEEQRAASHSAPAMIMRDDVFADFLDYVAEEFEVIPVSRLLAASQRPGTKPRCAVTLDDGWADNFTTAFPVLKERGIPATIFLVTGLVGTEQTFWVERLLAACKSPEALVQMRARVRSSSPNARLDSVGGVIEFLKRMDARSRAELLEGVAGSSAHLPGDRMMSWEQVRQMRHAGVEFGGHTESHPLLSYENGDTVARELKLCRDTIQEQLGQAVTSFAYPNGDFNDPVRKQVQAAGYELAFTLDRGWYRPGNDPLSIRRVLLHDGCVTDGNGRFSPSALEWMLRARG